MEWKNIYRGFFMGISDLIPGVSGGTIAFILGIYDDLLASISGFFSRHWKKHIGFLLPLAIGIGAALLSLSRVMEYLLKNHYAPTQFFFIGLIVGVLPFIAKKLTSSGTSNLATFSYCYSLEQHWLPPLSSNRTMRLRSPR